MIQVLEEFYNIFGPELKAVTGDPKRIEDVLKRVDELVLPIESVKAEPFELKASSMWRSVMHAFEREVQAIEGMLLCVCSYLVKNSLTDEVLYGYGVDKIRSPLIVGRDSKFGRETLHIMSRKILNLQRLF